MDAHPQSREIDAIEVNGGAGIGPTTEEFVPMPRMLISGVAPGLWTTGIRRHELGQAFDRLDPELLDRPGGQRGNRHRRDLDVGGARLRGGHRDPFGDRGQDHDDVEGRSAGTHVDLGAPRLEPGGALPYQ